MSKHQPCYVCGHDFVGPDIGFGVNLCDTCKLRYGELHAKIKQLQVRADAAESNFRTEHDAVTALEDLAETAWGIIANAYGGNWDLATEASGWKAAAERWRENYKQYGVTERLLQREAVEAAGGTDEP